MQREAYEQEELAQETARGGKWIVLAWFAAFAGLQGLQWLTFSAVDPEKVEQFFSPKTVDASTVALLLNWGPIFGLAMFPIQAWMLLKPHGLWSSGLVGAILCFISGAIRLIPDMLGQEFRSTQGAVIIAHLSQILNAAAGPLCLGTTSRMSRLWFPSSQRTISTGVIIATNTFGTNLCFLLGPAIVHEASDLQTLFWVEFALSFILLMAFVLIPHSPHDLPDPLDPGVSLREGCEKLQNRSFAITVLSAGTLNGMFSGWISQFQTILKGKFDEEVIGWLGFLNGMAVIAASTAIGFFSRPERVKNEVMVAMAVLLALLGVFSELVDYLPVHFWHDSSLSMGVILSGVGLACGALQPQMFELAAQIVYPMNEGTTVGLLVFLWNVSAFFMIAVTPKIDSEWVTFIYMVGLILSLMAFTFVQQPQTDIVEVPIRQQDRQDEVDDTELPLLLDNNDHAQLYGSDQNR